MGRVTGPGGHASAPGCRRRLQRAHLLRWPPPPHAQRTESTPRVQRRRAASHLDPFEPPTPFRRRVSTTEKDAFMNALDTWGPRSRSLGAYLHIPFCTQRCGYCSFNTAPDGPRAIERFLPALVGEMDLVAAAPWAGGVGVRSVFLGGGTPSLLPTLDRLHTAAQAREAFEAARAAGFHDVSLDLIYGLPGLDLSTWEATVK